MSLTNPNTPVSQQDLQDFYHKLLPYLGGSVDAGFTPVGTVISVMGKTAPANYLVCDGSTYNIVDYPELAGYFLQQFESVNYFGGDGTTTFAVPDLQGEFLRGAGTNSHTNQGSGGEVGDHQDATLHGKQYLNSSGNTAYYGLNNESDSSNNFDSQMASTRGREFFPSPSIDSYSNKQIYTSRPTNTSVLFCIATKNIYLDPSLDYSTDEKIVGTWIDGKPLYAKTIQAIIPTAQGTPTDVSIGASVDTVVDVKTMFATGNGGFIQSPVINGALSGSVRLSVYNNGYTVASLQNKFRLEQLSETAVMGGSSCYVTVQYTKTTD